MKLIVGLGNPGIKYKFTRHNIGFMVIEELIKLGGFKTRSNRRFKATLAEGVIEGENCMFSMPQTFMNLSGHCARKIINWLKIDLESFLLVMDDTALPFGNIRIRTKGSSGGHKGLGSVIDCLGTAEFPRVRIGVMGREGVTDYSDYVLDRFTKVEEKQLPKILKQAVLACECWVKEGVNSAMNRYNK